VRLTSYRRGYIDGLHGEIMREGIGKQAREYYRGYAKGLYWATFRSFSRP